MQVKSIKLTKNGNSKGFTIPAKKIKELGLSEDKVYDLDIKEVQEDVDNS